MMDAGSHAVECWFWASSNLRSTDELGCDVRRLEQGGFTHDQAVSVSEVFQDEIVDKIATKEYVELVLKREVALLENRITSKFNTLIMWLAGIAILQTATIIFGTAGLVRLLS
jgi:hypothetical protein